MKKTLVIAFIILTVKSFAQDTINSVEKKYDFVEVWGLKNQTKKDFLTEIASYPEGICEQSLTKMGLLDGNKIPLPFSNKIIVTTRDIPDYRKSKIYKELINRSEQINSNKWEKLVEENNKLGSYEKQQLPQFLKLFKTNDKSGIDSLFTKVSNEFKEYGIELEKAKIYESYSVYEKYAKQFSKEEVLYILYILDINDPKYEAASFIANNYLNNSEDLLDFLPLLLKKKSGVQPIINSFITKFNGKVDWEDNLNELTDLINNPNPFQCLLVLRIADKTGFTKLEMKGLNKTSFLTIKDILKPSSAKS